MYEEWDATDECEKAFALAKLQAQVRGSEAQARGPSGPGA
jgi:hypothetical protein